MALASVKRHSREYKTLLALDADMKELQRLFNEGLAAKESDTAESTSEVKYSSAEENNNSSIKQQLKEHSDEINALEPVADIKYTHIKNKKLLKETIIKEYKKFGMKIDRQGFGIIEIGEKQISDSFKYVSGEAEFAAFFTIPQVLKRGIEIASRENHKARAHGTVTLAAPVRINGVTGNVAVVVKQTGKNRYKTHRILMPDGSEFVFNNINDTELTYAGMPTNESEEGPTIDSVSDISISNPAEIVKENSESKKKLSVREPMQDSNGKELTPEQAEFFKDSKVRDEDGNLLVVYHGTSEKFTVFDNTKGRANMDIQGSFFSPWAEDAKGYGKYVDPYYLNISNPASEGKAYKALNMFKGQNEAGIKAREYLKRLGYDGVNNSNEEYIAFYPDQIKLTDNLAPTGNEDIRYSVREMAEKPWEEQLKIYKHSDTLVLSKTTPWYLVKDGIKENIIGVPVSVLSKSVSGKDISHSIKLSKLKDLDTRIQNPILTAYNAKRKSIVFVTDKMNEGGFITVAVLNDQRFDGENIHKATTIHSRKDVTAILQKLSNDSIVYINKNNEFNYAPGSSIISGTLNAAIKLIDMSLSQSEQEVNNYSYREFKE